MNANDAKALRVGTRVIHKQSHKRGAKSPSRSYYQTDLIAINWDDDTPNTTAFCHPESIAVDEDSNAITHLYHRYEMVRIITLLQILKATNSESSLHTLRKYIRANIAKRWRQAFPDYAALRQMMDDMGIVNDPQFDAAAQNEGKIGGES